MKNPLTRGLLPALNRVMRSQKENSQHDIYLPAVNDYVLVEQTTRLENRPQVERFLPDILGRALARSWIDISFRDRFMANPKQTLADYYVYLPENISIEIETNGTTRPRVVVYEQKRLGGPKLRVLYLQLVMMAGR